MPRPEAERLVREEFSTRILPQGQATPDQFLFSIFHASEHVGFLHLGKAKKHATTEIFAWDFVVFETHRRQGLGRAAMEAAAPHLKEAGITRVALNVFGSNDPARRLYESMGFRVTQMQMARDL